ncbi:uncharacterized protein LOC142485032 isoform X2 [Ascaphus truei]|uniref:uncharacterized protein LOC142485032 isoform X2 n=1 Tax=Ascaphus truei TaxID=8439 RepID=UPI003F5AA51B
MPVDRDVRRESLTSSATHQERWIAFRRSERRIQSWIAGTDLSDGAVSETGPRGGPNRQSMPCRPLGAGDDPVTSLVRSSLAPGQCPKTSRETKD